LAGLPSILGGRGNTPNEKKGTQLLLTTSSHDKAKDLSRHTPSANTQKTMSSSNIKSWADASSDSDSEDERIAPPPSNLPGSAITDDEDDAEFDDGGFFPGKTLDDMPKEAPFTAFVGNLNRGMEGKEFRVEVERLLVDRGVSFACVFGCGFSVVDVSMQVML
jgi:hypothetical protein